MLNWWGVLAPAGTPAAIVTKMHGALAAMLREADVKEALAREEMDAVGSTPAQFAAYIRAEIAKWTEVVRATGAQLD